MPNFNEPQTSTTYTSYSQAIRDARESVAKWFDATTDTNLVSGFKRWSATNRRFEVYDGSAWGELLPMATAAQAYQIRVERANSADSADSVAGANVSGTVASATNAANLGGVAASQYVQTTDSRMTNSRQCNNSFDSVSTARTNLDVAQIPIGTRMYFYQASAPTGWVIVTGLGDRLLAVGTYNGATSGNTSGSWQQEGHTLTTSEIPSHNHTGSSVASDGSHTHSIIQAASDSGSFYAVGTGLQTWNNSSSSYIASGGAHAHTLTIASQGGGVAHSHGNTWRPASIVGLVAQRSS